MMEAAVMIIAISVAVLSVFFILTLRKVQASLDTANQTLAEARDAIHAWKDDVEGLVVSVKDLTDQVNKQVESVDPLMASVRNMGEALQDVTSSARDASTSWMSKVKRQAEHTSEKTRNSLLDWIETGVKAYNVVRSAADVVRAAPKTAQALRKELREDAQPVRRTAVTAVNETRLAGQGEPAALG